MAVGIGSLAPDFTLPNQDRQPVSLSAELRTGPVILAFVPAAFSDTCTKEVCTFRDTLGLLKGVSPRLLVVSVDSFFALRAWADAQHFEFPLLSDFNKVVIREYGVFNEEMIGLKGLAKRAVFVIDRAGMVRYREVLDDARNEPDYARTRDVFASLVA
jgi:peroxiredoxin